MGGWPTIKPHRTLALSGYQQKHCVALSLKSHVARGMVTSPRNTLRASVPKCHTETCSLRVPSCQGSTWYCRGRREAVSLVLGPQPPGPQLPRDPQPPGTHRGLLPAGWSQHLGEVRVGCAAWSGVGGWSLLSQSQNHLLHQPCGRAPPGGRAGHPQGPFPQSRPAP